MKNNKHFVLGIIYYILGILLLSHALFASTFFIMMIVFQVQDLDLLNFLAKTIYVPYGQSINYDWLRLMINIISLLSGITLLTLSYVEYRKVVISNNKKHIIPFIIILYLFTFIPILSEIGGFFVFGIHSLLELINFLLILALLIIPMVIFSIPEKKQTQAKLES